MFDSNDPKFFEAKASKLASSRNHMSPITRNSGARGGSTMIRNRATTKRNDLVELNAYGGVGDEKPLLEEMLSQNLQAKKQEDFISKIQSQIKQLE